jgi:Holliday junction resolvase RusA-like endonuclease
MATTGSVRAGDDPYVKPPDSMRFIIPFLPPSSNKIYVTDWRRKRRFKSREAQAFSKKFMQEVIPPYLPWISQMIGPEQDSSVVYDIFADFYFPRKEVLNMSYGDGTKKAAKTRYKKMDTGNRLKLLVDCVSQALAIDDSHFFGISGRKRAAETYNLDPQVHIFLTRQSPEVFGV